MSQSPKLTRRAALASAAAVPFAATAGRVSASAPMMGAGTPTFNRFTMGEYEVTTLLAGTRTVPDPQKIFGMNVSEDEFNAVSTAAKLPTDAAQFFFTPTVINTGAELILFDTGLSGESITSALGSAGYTPDQVDVVVITHMHGDHIGGLMTNGAPTFPNARYVTGRVEYDAWAQQENEGFDAMVRPLAEQMTFLEGGNDVASGISAVEAFGHTPGHMTYMVDTGGKLLLLAADLANHYVWSLAHPDWEVRFDMDKDAAAATRRRVLSMVANEEAAFVGYHMPWPGVGFVDTHEDGFTFVPHTYQLML